MILEQLPQINSTTEVQLLEQAMNDLVGQSLLTARLGYGGELFLHFGKPIPRRNQKFSQTKGTFVLGVLASGWRLEANDGGRIEILMRSSDADAEDDNAILRNFGRLYDFGISAIKTSLQALPHRSGVGIGLTVFFVDGGHFIVLPSDDTDSDALPDRRSYRLRAGRPMVARSASNPSRRLIRAYSNPPTSSRRFSA